ncbi:MAG TPA: RNA polymerase sigma factor [Candidatus Mediterraneibacter merdavium]|nr:RNA polymerase sigma factor [Candidatus Mediterraneibacter merdavium]
MYSDFLLIRKMRQGDDASFDLFIRTYYKDIFNYCRRRCGDMECAEDLTQETFLRFFTKLSEYRHRGKARNYLYTIAGNLCKDHLKKRKEIPSQDAEMFEREGQKECRTEEILDRLLIEEALDQLSDELREVIVLYYFQGLKLAEISDVLQIGLPLVKYRLRQAKKQMEIFLREEEEHGTGRKA